MFNYFYVKLKHSLKGQMINVENKAAIMMDNGYWIGRVLIECVCV